MKQNCHAELVSASVPCRELPLTLARSRNKFGMTVKNIPSLRATEGSVAIHSTLVLRLAFSCSTRGKCAYVLSALRTPLAHANATARACSRKRGFACKRARLYTRQALFRGSARLGLYHGGDTVIRCFLQGCKY